MNKTLSLFAFLLLVFQLVCNGQTIYKSQINYTSKSGKKLYIQDSTDYSIIFRRNVLNLLKMDFYKSIKLVSEHMIINDADTVDIPTGLPTASIIRYQSNPTDSLYTLEIKRINYSDVEYVLNLDDKIINSGTAVLQATFYWGSEVIEDPPNPTKFLHQYIDNKDCWTNIKIQFPQPDIIQLISLCNKDEKGNVKRIPILTRQK